MLGVTYLSCWLTSSKVGRYLLLIYFHQKVSKKSLKSRIIERFYNVGTYTYLPTWVIPTYLKEARGWVSVINETGLFLILLEFDILYPLYSQYLID